MLFIFMYLPLKYLLFTLHALYNIQEIIVSNSVIDICLVSIFILFKGEFAQIDKIYLLVLENIFWIYYIFQNSESVAYTMKIVGFIILYRLAFLYIFSPALVLALLIKEAILFCTLIVVKVKGESIVDFLSYIFCILGFYLQITNIKYYLLSFLINLGIALLYRILILFLKGSTTYFLHTK
jgi:hypothetical protein